MSDDINDICVQLVYALGAWERGEAGAKERHQALHERLQRMAKGGAQPRRPCLRLVHSDGSYPTCRATSGDGIDRESTRPRLTLIQATGLELPCDDE